MKPNTFCYLNYEVALQEIERLKKENETLKAELAKYKDAEVHGRWIERTFESRAEFVYTLNYKCSICDFQAKYGGWSYCPVCGARMDGGAE